VMVELGGEAVKAQRVAQDHAGRQDVAKSLRLFLVGALEAEAEQRARQPVVRSDDRAVDVVFERWMEDLRDPGMGGQHSRDLRGARAAALIGRLGLG
jgi:hypothetical protein